MIASKSHEKKTKYTSGYLQLLLPPRHPKQTEKNHKHVSRYMAGRETIVDEVSCFVDIKESCIDS